jgi:NADH dehydrogenase (ubiquinone) Fe-S protein 1
MWELSPSLVRYGTLERTSPDITLAGLKTLAAQTASAKVTGAPFLKPISNFYQTDPISRACVWLPFHGLLNLIMDFVTCRSVTMAQCTRAFVKGEEFRPSESAKSSQAAYA